MSSFIKRVAVCGSGWLSAINRDSIKPKMDATDSNVQKVKERSLETRKRTRRDSVDSVEVVPLVKRVSPKVDFQETFKTWSTDPLFFDKPDPHMTRDRILAQYRIQEFLEDCDQNILDWSDLRIGSLPDIFSDQSFQRLQFLRLNGTSLTALPESIFQLPENCTVLIAGLSASAVNQLKARTQESNYQGPKFVECATFGESKKSCREIELFKKWEKELEDLGARIMEM